MALFVLLFAHGIYGLGDTKPDAAECYAALVEVYQRGRTFDVGDNEAVSLTTFFSAENTHVERCKSAFQFAQAGDIASLPLLRLSQFAINDTDDVELRCIAVVLIAKGMLDINRQPAAERSLFEIERDRRADESVRSTALIALWTLTSSPNVAIRDARKIASEREATDDAIKSLGLQLLSVSAIAKRINVDATANCFIAAYDVEMPAKRRIALVELIADFEKYDRSTDCLSNQTLRDIHEIGEYEFCLDSNSEIDRIIATHLIDPSRASSRTRATAAAISNSKEVSSEFRERINSLRQRIEEGRQRRTAKWSDNP